MIVRDNFDLTNYNSYRIKASCKKAYFPETVEGVVDFFALKIPYILLGSGHNIILSQPYYDTNFLIFNGTFDDVSIDKSGLLVGEASATLLNSSQLALEKGFSGLEMFYDIPSSLGGAVVMNAGSSGEEMKDLIVKVQYFDLDDGSLKVLYNKDLGFEYRNSFFQSNHSKIVLKAWLQLTPGHHSDIRKKMDNIKTRRWSKQPREYPNAGSVFKRPKGYFVGAMMEDLKLKGFKIGGAKISEKHGGFIVNHDNASGKDILDIIEEAKKRVKKEYGVDLEVEQRII